MADGQTLVSETLQRAARSTRAPVMREHQPEAGFAVGAILFVLTMAGVAGAVLFSGTSQVLRTNIEITRDNTAKNDLLAAARTLSASSSLINSGLNVQPPAALAFGSADSTKLPTGYAVAGSAGAPTSVGVMTAGAGTRQLDPWNKYFIYCRWEGLTSPGTDPGIMLISAGPDGVLNTNCGSSTAQNDDKIELLSVGQLIDRANVWQYQNPGTPQVQFGIGTNAVKATDAGDLSANSLTLAGALNAASLNLSAPLPITQGGTGATTAGSARTSLGSGTTGDSLFTATTAAGARGVLGSTTVGDALFIAATAGAGRTALGATATGSSLFTATDAAAARSTLGATTVGDSVFTAADAAAGRTALGASTVGGGLFTAANAAAARSVLGAGATGDSLFQTTTAANARSVLGAGATGEAVFASANQTAALTALGLIGGSATLDIGITGTANTATYLADGGNILAGTVPIARGGTGAGTAATARAALGADNATNLTSGTLSWTRLPTSGVVAGAYNWGTVNAYGIVTDAQNVVTNTLAQNNSGITITDTTAGVGTDGQIAFNVEGTTYGLMDYQGFLGLNTAAPQDRLHIKTGNIRIEGAAATDRLLRFTTGATSRRWELGTDNTAEAGSNAGSNFVIRNYDDSGVLLGTPFSIDRATGNVTFSGNISAGNIGGGGGGNINAFSALTAAEATNSINNTNYAQAWAWNTLAGASALTLSSTSTAAAGNTQTILNIALSGANATSTQTTYGAQIANTHTGTSSTNVGLSVSASGGTNNYGLLVPSGRVGIGTTTPAPGSALDVVGILNVRSGGANNNSGASSGDIVIPYGKSYRSVNSAGNQSIPIISYGSFGGTGESITIGYGASANIWPASIQFWTSSYPAAITERMRINASGNVGIGTTAPVTALDVNGSVRVANNATACTSTIAGAIRYNGSGLDVCTNAVWTGLSTTASPPNAFSFTDQTGVALNSTITSNSVTLTGFIGSLSATCVNCTAIARNGVWGGTTLAGFVAGDTIAIRQTSSVTGGVATTATVTVGGTTSGTWTVTTTGSGPNAFSFTNVTGATPNITYSSDAVTLSGFSGSLTATCSGSCFSIARNGVWGGISVAGFVSGDSIALRMNSAPVTDDTRTAAATVGTTTSSSWTVTTAAACQVGITIGQTCPDGSIYAGFSPDGNVAMYTTPCDAGFYLNNGTCTACSSGLWSGSGSTCSTTYSSSKYLTWNKGTTNWTVTGYTPVTTGFANTTGLSSLLDSGSPYRAAQYCDTLSAFGKSDWYLPARDELNVLFTNRSSIGNFDTTSGDGSVGGANPGLYWSSSEYNVNYSWYQRFSDGNQGSYGFKNSLFSVRCIRR